AEVRARGDDAGRLAVAVLLHAAAAGGEAEVRSTVIRARADRFGDLVREGNARLEVVPVAFVRRPAVAVDARIQQAAAQRADRLTGRGIDRAGGQLERIRRGRIVANGLAILRLGHRRLIIVPKSDVQRCA